VLDEIAAVVYVAEMAPESEVPALHEPLPVAEEYHWYENVEVPPASWDVRVMVCPLSIAGAAGVTAPADSTGFTVTRSQADPTLSGPALLLSVTW
jgi:hypothetical protein